MPAKDFTRLVHEPVPRLWLLLVGILSLSGHQECSAAAQGDSDVAGRANVLIFPDLNSANNTYKVRPCGSA